MKRYVQRVNDLSSESTEARKHRNGVFNVMKGKQTIITKPVSILISISRKNIVWRAGKISTFSNDSKISLSPLKIFPKVK